MEYKNNNKKSNVINFSVDIETDGNLIGKNSMISFGIVLVDENLNKTFYGELKPIGDDFSPKALEVANFTREETLNFKDASEVMKDFQKWIKEVNPENKRLLFWSDNNGFDFAWINWYCLTFLNENPFGHSSFNLGSLYKGLVKDCYKNFKFLRKTKHTHNALDDAKGNAEAMLQISKNFNINGFKF